jgi:hypothetical protein
MLKGAFLIIAALASPAPPAPSFPPPVVMYERMPSIDEAFKDHLWKCPAVGRAMTKPEVMKALEPCWLSFLPHA